MRSGTIIKNKISDCLIILNNRIIHLKKNYNQITLDLINDINLTYNSQLNPFMSEITISIIIISIIILIIILIGIIYYIIINCVTQNNKNKEEE